MIIIKTFLESNNKPKDWPVNNREAKLEYVYRAVEKFKDNPNYKNREVLLAILNEHDLNQRSYEGELRVTEYEVEMINLLYAMGTMYNINSLKTFLYEIVGDTTRFQKMNSWMDEILGKKTGIGIPAYDKILLLPLKIYHYAYQKYNVDKDKDFAYKIIELVEELTSFDDSIEMLDSVTAAFTSMMSDISFAHGTKKSAIWRFSREELKELFSLEITLINKLHQNPIERPLKGILMMQLSNFILKSRNDYNEDYICKYVSTEVAKLGADNHQLWMKKTELLNDDREEKVVLELFEEKDWLPKSWAQNIDFSETRTYYVSSFSKELNCQKMKDEYGGCIYGFKDDRIAELIAPIYEQDLVKKKDVMDDDMPDRIRRPFLAQVLAFDILYDRNQAKEEIAFLIELIEQFDISDEHKKTFLQDIMQYWILSVKDKEKWEYEKERRYVLFLYDEYKYTEMEKDDTFLKVKTSIFLTPDFILGEKNPTETVIRKQVNKKMRAISWKAYVYCDDCMNRDYDAILDEKIKVCPVCSSSRIHKIYP